MKLKRIFFAFCLLFANPAWAGNVFQVDRIKVDVSAASTTLARATALQRGQAEALSKAMQRLVKQEEWERLPDIRTLDIENLVEVLRISDEKTGPTRYLATLSVEFKRGPLRDLLRSYGVAVTEVQNKPALLLPVLEDLQGLQAWGEHWWQQGWQNFDIDNNPAPLMLPMGDIEDSMIANAEDILIGDPIKLQTLNDRYGTQTVIVAHALADVEGQLGVTAYIFGAESSDVIVRTYRTGQPHEDMGRVAVDEISAALAERWKQVAAVASDERQMLRVRAAYPGLKDWTRLLSRLNEAKLVRDVTIVELAKNYAYVDIAYIGSVSQLGGNLGQRGLVLAEQETGGWTVTTEENAVVQVVQ
ncbi:DUF2066 domain-containing protein [Alphaproteobacteria bacterium]|jgi:hypothetical protein|nr:DUF2066 domain-containing protein [Alphaproteobacteria bacterium]MDB2431235.1 DUF2066 domain-containing protein [Alphaproteobacteria bacterium]MDB2487133.1 DUF2066 domain-containing protein [Alphaproteobacteria bacterium]MDB2541682.1 DUF2066 domain-containing protein [Alphaproteobacteria bacterium]